MGQVGSKVGLKGRFEDYFSMPSQPITQVELGPSKNIPEYLLMKHIRVIWQIETELDEWENVGQGFWYIPTENNLGYRLRVCVYQLQFVTNTSEPTPPEAIGQEWQITELDPNLINIRSILNPLECDPFDKILLTTLDGAPASEFAELEIITYPATGMVDFKRHRMRDFEIKYHKHQKEQRKQEERDRRYIPKEALSAPDPLKETMVNAAPVLEVRQGPLIWSAASSEPVGELLATWIKRRRSILEKFGVWNGGVSEAITNTDELFRLNQEYSIFLQDHMTTMTWHCSQPLYFDMTDGYFDEQLSPAKKSAKRQVHMFDVDTNIVHPDMLRNALIADAIIRRSPDCVSLQELTLEATKQIGRYLFCLYDGSFLSLINPRSVASANPPKPLNRTQTISDTLRSSIGNQSTSLQQQGHPLSCYFQYGNAIFWRRTRLRRVAPPLALDMYERQILPSGRTMDSLFSPSEPKGGPLSKQMGETSKTTVHTATSQLQTTKKAKSPSPQRAIVKETPIKSHHMFDSGEQTTPESRESQSRGTSEEGKSFTLPVEERLRLLNQTIRTGAERMGLTEMRALGVFLEVIESDELMKTPPLVMIGDEINVSTKIAKHLVKLNEELFHVRKQEIEKFQFNQDIKMIEKEEKRIMENQRKKRAELDDEQRKLRKSKRGSKGDERMSHSDSANSRKQRASRKEASTKEKKEEQQIRKQIEEGFNQPEGKQGEDDNLLELPTPQAVRPIDLDAVLGRSDEEKGGASSAEERKSRSKDKSPHRDEPQFKKRDRYSGGVGEDDLGDLEANVEALLRNTLASSREAVFDVELESLGDKASKRSKQGSMSSTHRDKAGTPTTDHSGSSESGSRSSSVFGRRSASIQRLRRKDRKEKWDKIRADSKVKSPTKGEGESSEDEEPNGLYVMNDHGRIVRANLDGSQRANIHILFPHTPVRSVKLPTAFLANKALSHARLTPFQHRAARADAYVHVMNKHETNRRFLVTSALFFGDATFGEDVRFVQSLCLARFIYFTLSRSTWGNGISLREDPHIISVADKGFGTSEASLPTASFLQSQTFPFTKHLNLRVPVLMCGDLCSPALSCPTLRILVKGMESSSNIILRTSPLLPTLLTFPSFVQNPTLFLDFYPRDRKLSFPFRMVESRLIAEREHKEYDLNEPSLDYFGVLLSRNDRDRENREKYKNSKKADKKLFKRGIIDDAEVARRREKRERKYVKLERETARRRNLRDQALMAEQQYGQTKLEVMSNGYELATERFYPYSIGKPLAEEENEYDLLCGMAQNESIRKRVRKYNNEWDHQSLGEMTAKELTPKDVPMYSIKFPVSEKQKRDGVLTILFDNTVDFTDFFTRDHGYLYYPIWMREPDKDTYMRPIGQGQLNPALKFWTRQSGDSDSISSSFQSPATVVSGTAVDPHRQSPTDEHEESPVLILTPHPTPSEASLQRLSAYTEAIATPQQHMFAEDHAPIVPLLLYNFPTRSNWLDEGKLDETGTSIRLNVESPLAMLMGRMAMIGLFDETRSYTSSIPKTPTSLTPTSSTASLTSQTNSSISDTRRREPVATTPLRDTSSFFQATDVEMTSLHTLQHSMDSSQRFSESTSHRHSSLHRLSSLCSVDSLHPHYHSHPSLPFDTDSPLFYTPFQMIDVFSYVTGNGSNLTRVYENVHVNQEAVSQPFLCSGGDYVLCSQQLHPIGVAVMQVGPGTPHGEQIANKQVRRKDEFENRIAIKEDLLLRKLQEENQESPERIATLTEDETKTPKTASVVARMIRRDNVLADTQQGQRLATPEIVQPDEIKFWEGEVIRNPEAQQDEEGIRRVNEERRKQTLRATLLLPCANRSVTGVIHRFWEDAEKYQNHIHKLLRDEKEKMLHDFKVSVRREIKQIFDSRDRSKKHKHHKARKIAPKVEQVIESSV